MGADSELKLGAQNFLDCPQIVFVPPQLRRHNTTVRNSEIAIITLVTNPNKKVSYRKLSVSIRHDKRCEHA